MAAASAGCAERRQSRAELRRRRITDAARKLFILNGFHATSMAQLAGESGVAVGQIYRDFASKEEVVAALVEANCSRAMMYDEVDAAIRDGDSDMVRAWLLDLLEPVTCRDDARLFAEIVAEAGRNERVAAIFRSLLTHLRERITAALVFLLPASADTARRQGMADALMVTSLGLSQFGRLALHGDGEPSTSTLRAIVARELDAVQEHEPSAI